MFVVRSFDFGARLGPALAMLLASLGTSIVNIALPSLAQSFHVGMSVVQWTVLGYLLAVTVAIVAAGRLGDRFGHRRMLAVGLALYTVAAALAALAPWVWLLIGARGVQGLGAALMMALPVALLRDTTPPQRLGRAMGLMGTTSAIGTALGPAMGGLLLTLADWRSIFAVLAVLGGVALAVVGFGPRAAAGPAAAQPDRAGAAAFAGAVAAYAVAMTVGPRHPLAMAGLVVLAAGLALWLLRIERAAASPFVPMAVLAHPGLVTRLAANGLVTTVMMTTLVVGPFYLSHGLGVAAWQAGLIMAIGPVTSALTGVPAGRLVDRHGSLPVARLGLMISMGGALVMALLPQHPGIWGYGLAIALMPPGFQLFQAAFTTGVMQGAGPAERGLISGLASLSRNLGLVTGASLMAAVYGWMAHGGDTAAAGRALTVTFTLAAALLGLALGLMQSARHRA